MMSPAMRITVNGEDITLGGPCTVAVLIKLCNLHKAPAAVEVNKTLVPKRRHAECALEDGDRVEIVTLVGGG